MLRRFKAQFCLRRRARSIDPGPAMSPGENGRVSLHPCGDSLSRRLMCQTTRATSRTRIPSGAGVTVTRTGFACCGWSSVDGISRRFEALIDPDLVLSLLGGRSWQPKHRGPTHDSLTVATGPNECAVDCRSVTRRYPLLVECVKKVSDQLLVSLAFPLVSKLDKECSGSARGKRPHRRRGPPGRLSGIQSSTK